MSFKTSSGCVESSASEKHESKYRAAKRGCTMKPLPGFIFSLAQAFMPGKPSPPQPICPFRGCSYGPSGQVSSSLASMVSINWDTRPEAWWLS